jgi:TonB family protein
MKTFPRGLLCGCTAVLLGCASGVPKLGMLGENFPPHDVAFLSYEAPVFPNRLRATSVTSGYGIVVITVREDGRIEDAVVVEASHSAFAEAILEAAPAWVFDVAAGETMPRREVLHYFFRRSGVATSLTHRDGARVPFEQAERGRPQVRMVSSLVLAPEPIAAEPAVVTPGAARPDAPAGAAEVSFVIDETGRVRVPAVTASTDPALGAAALATVKQWRFVPPRHDGVPVLVEVVRSFTFAPVDP